MKNKNIRLFWALSLTALLFTGCSSLNSQARPITSVEAKTLALADAGIPADAVEHTASTLSSRNKIDYYAVTFTAGGMKYEYDIDSMTGTVIESRTISQQPDSGTLADAGTQATPESSGFANVPDGSRPAASGASADGLLTENEAKEKALAKAGFSADQAAFTKCKLDFEDGRQVYEVDFYIGSNEKYSYDIDAKTGEIVSSDYKIKDKGTHQNGSDGGTEISAQRAKEIALKQVPGAAEADIREFKTDLDDGRLEYEGKIIYNEMKYKFEIDGYSGAIRSWEAESAYN